MKKKDRWEFYLKEIKSKEPDALGIKRREKARREGRIEKVDRGEDFTSDKWGARGEYAFSEMSGLKWNKKIDKFSNAPDVGDDVQVVTRTNADYDLIVRKNAPDHHRFVLLITTDGVNFKAHGWILGKDAKKHTDRLKDYGNYGEEAFFIPRHLLHPMDEWED